MIVCRLQLLAHQSIIFPAVCCRSVFHHFSYELLLMNAASTIIGLWLAVKPEKAE